MNIAITGTVSSGKSKVAAMLAAAMQIESVDSDLLCRQMLQPGLPCWRELQERWNGRFFDTAGILDRISLREAVFSEPDVREALENILHPRVREAVAARRQKAALMANHLLVEVPLLFETGWNGDFDHVVTVYAPAALSVARTVLRDKVSAAQAESILALQLSADEKAERADSVIDNSGTWAATAVQVSLLARKLQRLGSDCREGSRMTLKSLTAKV